MCSCCIVKWGPSIKYMYVTLEGAGVRESVTVCDRGRGSRACDVTLIIFFIIYIKHEILIFSTFCCNRCILTEESTDKTTPDKTFQTKDPRTKAPGQKPSQTIEREFVQMDFFRIF